jgi:hypothetical protein
LMPSFGITSIVTLRTTSAQECPNQRHDGWHA